LIEDEEEKTRMEETKARILLTFVQVFEMEPRIESWDAKEK
jgi:hypothetical protein